MKEREEKWVWLYDGRAGILTGRRYGKLWEVLLPDGFSVFSEPVDALFIEKFSAPAIEDNPLFGGLCYEK